LYGSLAPARGVTAADSFGEPQRQAVFEKVLEIVSQEFMGPEPDIQMLRRDHERDAIQSATTEDEFEQAITHLLTTMAATGRWLRRGEDRR
jgi:hypothetical protein